MERIFPPKLDDAALAALAYRLAPIVAARIGNDSERTQWAGVEAAAQHLQCPRSRIYALVHARRIPFYKDGSRLLFRLEELNEWVRAGGGKQP